MACRIVWTAAAEEDYENIVKYLKNSWSDKIAKEFAIECLMKIELLSILPSVGNPSFKDPLIRKLLISKHNYLYYKFEGKLVTLLSFIDTRKEPASNPFN